MGGNIGPIADHVGIPGNSVTVSVTTKGGSAEKLIAQYHLKGKGITVAVTGANGFIGSHIVKQLLGKGYCVRGTVRDDVGVDFLKVLPGAAENLSLFYKKELLVDGCFDEVFDGCDCVFHLASPTLKDEHDLKMPEDVIDQAVTGTLNVLQSCKKTGVKTVVLTSSMCAACPKPDVPEIIHEAHWADPDFLINKGSYYAASKTKAERAAVNFVKEKMTTESAFRLVRICPTFTVGPMLHPTVNSSMGRFAAICAGLHHKRIPNRSISLVDVRDTAAHHIAAYEKGVEGRFLSLTEAWPWTLVYHALKIHRPQMRSPEALPKETKLRAPRKYNTTRMKHLGVNERSFMHVLGDAIKACEDIKLTNGPVSCVSLLPQVPLEIYLNFAGYYDIGMGDGRFFMIEVLCEFLPDKRVSNYVQLSWVLEVGTKVTILEISESTSASFKDGNLTWIAQNISLSFNRINEGNAAGVWAVNGTIGGVSITGKSFIGGVPYQAFMGKYSTMDASKSVSLDFAKYKNTITDSEGYVHETFSYNPLQRSFSYTLNNVPSRLYLNVADGQGLSLAGGLCLTFVVIDGPKSSTTLFFKNPVASQPGAQAGTPVGAEGLAPFAGYYPLSLDGSFVSILAEQNVAKFVFTCIDDKTPTVYTSFDFDVKDNVLTFPPALGGLSLTFQRTFSNHANAEVTVTEGQTVLFRNIKSYFTPAPLNAFGFFPLTGTEDEKKYSVQITQEDNGDLRIVFKQDDEVISSTTDYFYNPIEQDATILSTDGVEYILNFTYQASFGVSCGITLSGGAFVAAVSAVGTVIR